MMVPSVLFWNPIRDGILYENVILLGLISCFADISTEMVINTKKRLLLLWVYCRSLDPFLRIEGKKIVPNRGAGSLFIT